MTDLYDKVKMLDLEVYDYKKHQAEADVKIKHDKDLFETVRNERNQMGKHLLESKVTRLPLLLKITCCRL